MFLFVTSESIRKLLVSEGSKQNIGKKRVKEGSKKEFTIKEVYSYFEHPYYSL